jgi:nitrogen PTS system EIIA component
MDLGIQEVAELLNVSSSTIRRWLKEGKIPAYRLNHQFRFSSMEIENWVMSHQTGKREESIPFSKEEVISLKEEKAETLLAKKIGSQTFSLFRAVHKGGVLVDVQGESKEEIIKVSIAKIAKDFELDEEVLLELFLDREKLMPTALNNGIGVPHTRDFLFPHPFDLVMVVFPKKPVEYGALDGKVVHTLFFLLAADEKRHLQLLAKIAHLVSDEESLRFLMKKPKQEILLNFLKKWEGQ